MNLDLDVWSIGALIVIGAIAYFGIRTIRNRIEEQRYRERMADLEFEASLLSGSDSLLADAANDAVFLQAITVDNHEIPSVSPEQAPPLRAEPKHAPSPSLNLINNGPVPAEIKAQHVMAKLQHSGLLRAVEGYVEVYGNPKGAAILRLRNGKLALLVPHMESESFLSHNSRRVDMIIMAGSDGNAFVVRPIEQVLAENITIG